MDYREKYQKALAEARQKSTPFLKGFLAGYAAAEEAYLSKHLSPAVKAAYEQTVAERDSMISAGRRMCAY